MLDQDRSSGHVGSKLLPPMLFSACFVCCDAGLLLPLHYRECVGARVSLALGENLVLKLFHCVKLSAYGLPL